MRRLALALVAVLAVAVPQAHAAPRASLTDIEDEVMCVVCNVPLNIAESPQADRERALIRNLIAQGRTKPQIKERLVAEYGQAVLATPHGGGVDWAAWAIPAALIAAVLAALAIVVPRWRRPGPSQPAPEERPRLDAADARRLEEDLARYEP